MLKNITRTLGVTLLILLIPLTLQLTIGTGVDGQGWNWTLSDFAIVGTLLFVVGFLIELVRVRGGRYKTAGIIAIILGFFLIYAELAVGLLTNWGS